MDRQNTFRRDQSAPSVHEGTRKSNHDSANDCAFRGCDVAYALSPILTSHPPTDPMSTTLPGAKAASTFFSIAITQAIAVVCFVVIPTAITLMAPLSTIQFKKTEKGNTVLVDRYLLIFIPWRQEQVENASKLHAEITEEKRYKGTSEERRKGQKGIRLATGQVTVIGNDKELVVQSAPDLAKSIVSQFDQFASTADAAPVIIPVYASWSLSYILGGAATFLCALYVFGVCAAIVTFPFRAKRQSNG